MTREITLDALAEVLRTRGASRRSLTGIAGAPGSGKSTLADALADKLNAAEPDSATVLPMDGYHYDDLVLEPRGWRPRKGAPHTYDVAGFLHMVGRLKANTEAQIALPVFDRSIEIARAGARLVPSTVRHVIVEGNYLLLDAPLWSDLADAFDTTVFIDVPMGVLERRLTERWKDMTPEDRRTKLEGNDLPNARRVVSERRASEFVLRAPAD